MSKAAIILIVVGVLVVVGGYWFVSSTQKDVKPPVVRDDTTLRSTTSGDVVGFFDVQGARAWMGVPFAAPPLGDRRWRAPQPVRPEQAPIEALAASSICPQKPSILSGVSDSTVTGDEDCLYLNIWSPPNAARLPVMFWIHGGGNSIGDRRRHLQRRPSRHAPQGRGRHHQLPPRTFRLVQSPGTGPAETTWTTPGTTPRST